MKPYFELFGIALSFALVLLGAYSAIFKHDYAQGAYWLAFSLVIRPS